MKLNSVMHNFGQAPTGKVPRSVFNRSHGFKTTFDAGDIVPIYVDEVLPGDTFNLKTTTFARLATPLVAPMDNLKMDVFFFFVPDRLVWDNHKKFMGEQIDPGDSIDYTIPQIEDANVTEGSLFDYYGVPTGIVSGMDINNLVGRGYNLIYNEWFRDENLIDSATVDKGDGPDTLANYVIRKRGKRHDYFTSCLPWPQKGTEVTLPLGTSAPVAYDGANSSIIGVESTVNGNVRAMDIVGSHLGIDFSTGSSDALYADLSNATAATLNALRLSIQTQEFLERDARGGTRYTEITRSHFGVMPPDYRLQRPELLGLGTVDVNYHPVPQTSESATDQLGTIGAFGTSSVTGGLGFNKTFTEHGIIHGFACVRADLTYQQGLERMWSRQTRYDYYWPTFAHLGEQSVLNKEIYADGSANDDAVFGYQEHWAEYRYKPSKITGAFRSSAASTLDMYHFSQEFGSLPSLDQTFIEETPPMARVNAVASEPDIIMDVYFNLKCVRPMPTFSIPGLGSKL